MKCEKCNEREANFFYSMTINGEKTEKHLCTQCAREEGLIKESTGFESFFDDSFFGGSLFGRGFRSLMPSFGLFGSPLGSIMAPAIPRIDLVIGEEPKAVPAEESESKIPSDAGAEVRRRREIDELKARLHEAVQAEDFEKAIEYRDKLRELEG